MAFKLHYFSGGRGRAEQVRLIMNEVGAEYEDIDVKNFGEYKAMGPKLLAFGSLPLLEDGDFKLVQGFVCAGYIARKFGLVGSDLQVAAKADAVAAGAEDLRMQFYKIAFGESTPATHEKFVSEVLVGRWLPNLEGLLELNGTGFFAGNSITHADTCVFDVVFTVMHYFKGASLDGFPLLQKFMADIQARPKLQAYLASPRSRPLPKRNFD
eukprot:TRINITY_DN3192_c0_g1_i1.p1 TRINITY_DN3192_c0_g1~~TRINITY_DN3192_c0_g1_i1.p1  ORF type:complete len:211 (+),score=55.88 TRINITY_DN3192_c0_g1_i1:74-706(+)